ncbi:ATP-binding cassette domain-containing protein [Labilibaculum sp. DW002]|uniref:ATP-binding cassette domain-containing protein n=1 Tax=Paralabilibaculum antarcticum TaxID=2912572 RepID=A0ABT5VTH4_9BACT|nr:ATP-binding cassette domain-containing protein [Labilibaculum sp. DW002]MDE5418717.1 ATP-binding cassette domain-containing protein [Labilibaculum sp. DW002]
MGESILNALMHLFAIVANAKEEGVSREGRVIVEGFLNRYVNSELQVEYLRLFENYSEFYRREMEYQASVHAQQANILSLTEASKVCSKIKVELVQEERLIVLMRLLEFVYEDKLVSENEFEFISIVAENFKIPRSEFINCLAFVWGDTLDEYDKSKFLIIDNKVTEWSENLSWFMKKDVKKKENDFKHLFCENLYGRLIVMFAESVNLLVFKYEGELNLYLEGNKIKPDRTYQLSNGSIIKGPNIKSIYYTDIAGKFLKEESQEKIIFSAKDIEFKFRNSHNGIHNFNISEKSGQLIGIMGGSGVGKSTLLNVLNGNLPLNSGEIFINDFEIHRNKSAIQGLIGFVPQDDLLIEELTVFQNLYYNAKLCFKEFTEHQILKTVHTLLHDLALYEARNLKVGNPLNKFISGGQRKRLNIGLELMREPSILLVDEPTSGLSSTDSEMIMNLLKQQTLKGKLVIANIHQPSSEIFKMFDKLWIMDKGGYPIYTGNPIDSIVYFKTQNSQVNAAESECITCGNVNPEQILQIVETRKIDENGKPTRERRILPVEWYEKYKENIEANHLPLRADKKLPKSNFKIPSKVKQFSIFWIRNLLSKLTNRQYLIINLFEAPLLAFILGFFTKYTSAGNYVFGDNKNYPVFLFMAVVVSMFIGLSVSAEEIIRDKKILQREKFLNLCRISYLASKIIFLFVLSAIQSISFVLIGNYILDIEGMTLSFWLVLFTTSCYSNMVGLNISSGLNSVITIYILIPLILVPQLLLGGAMIKFDDLHGGITNKTYVPIIGDLMTTRWAYEAMAVTQFKDNEFEKHFFDYEKGVSDAAFTSSFLIPKIESILIDCERNIEFEKNSEETNAQFLMLQNEIERLAEEAGFNVFPEIKELNIYDFNLNVAENTRHFLDKIKLYYVGLGSESGYKKDFQYSRLVDSLGRDGVYNFKQNYYNQALADLVLNRTEVNKMIEVDERLVQKKDPIFMYPDSRFGRAHFYAPVKRIWNYYIDTYWFNLMIIWLGTALLFFTLWSDVLRKVMNYIEGIKLVRREKKRK